jgi:hypothetical protein
MAPRAASRAPLLLPLLSAAVLLCSATSAAALDGEICTTYSSEDGGGCTRKNSWHYSRFFNVPDGGIIRGFTARSGAWYEGVATYVIVSGVSETQCDWFGGGYETRHFNCADTVVPPGADVRTLHTSLGEWRNYVSGAPCNDNGHATVSFEVCRPKLKTLKGIYAALPSMLASAPPTGAVLVSSDASGAALSASLGAGVTAVGENVLAFDGLPAESATSGVTVSVGEASAAGAGVSVTISGAYSLLQYEPALVEGYSDNRYRHLFNFSGLTAVIHGDRLWVGNALGGAVHCGGGADLRGGASGGSGAPGAPSWPAGVSRSITVRVSATGEVSILIDGVPAAPPPPAAVEEEASPAPGCVPPVVPAGAVLQFGTSGHAGYDDTFSGTMTQLGFAFDA